MLGPAVVKERLGHSDISTTQLYLDALPDSDGTSLDAFSKIRNRSVAMWRAGRVASAHTRQERPQDVLSRSRDGGVTVGRSGCGGTQLDFVEHDARPASP